jgi:hypothetical protein
MITMLNRYHDLFQTLARGAQSAHRVYTCPTCGIVDAIHVYGEEPRCINCNKVVTYTYARDDEM